MAKYTSSGKTRREIITDTFKILAPALFIFAAALVVFFAGSRLNASWNEAVRNRQADVNTRSVEQLQLISRVQMLKEEKKAMTGAVDMGRKRTDDLIFGEMAGDLFSFRGFEEFSEKSLLLAGTVDEDGFAAVRALTMLGDVEEASEGSAVMRQDIYVQDIVTYLYSFDDYGNYYYYAVIPGRRECEGITVDGDAFLAHADFRWLMTYAVTEDGAVINLRGFDII